MPVVDGVLVPNVPLTAAERVVDFPALNQHIIDRRAAVEQAGRGAARRIAYAAIELGYTVAPAQDLERRLIVALERTARFGHRHARREIRLLRTGVARAAVAPIVRHDLDPETAAAGLEAVLRVIRERAARVAEAVAIAARQAALDDPSRDDVLRRIAVAEVAARTLHNNVLELVGVTLNYGRIAGAMSMERPPEFALRSEQLDKATCDACTRLHGTIALVGSDEFFALTPPAECFGGGRCRGVWIFGDTPNQVELPDAA